MMDRGNLIVLVTNKRAESENFVMGSDAAEFVSKSKTKFEADRKCRTLQNQVKSIQWFGECWWLRRWMRRHLCERISWKFKIQSWIPEISLWSTCLPSHRKWWVNKMRSTVWTTFNEERFLGNNCHWLVMKPLSIFSAQKSTSSQILCCAQRLWGINGEPTEFEWKFFPGFTTLQLCGEVTDLLSDFGERPEIFTGRILFMSMFNDISCDRKGNKEECLANARVVEVLAKKFGIGQWSFNWSRFWTEVVFCGRE